MKVISSGERFEVFGDTLCTYDKFPTQSYIVRFSQFKGFYLEKYADIEISEEKIYGVHTEKVDKVLNSFAKFNRSLGVILSGDKGIGKSLFAKLLSVEAAKRGIPLIIVDKFVPGIAAYIDSIDQEIMVLFDEFDKTFGEKVFDDGVSPQASLLSLFDGVSGGKKLFVITCNEIRGLNNYLLNRPGRFHYHFRFNYPTPEEVREYLTDKLQEEYYGEIDSIIAFSRRTNLNYDCLRAIAFEVNNGIPFKDAILDLNILNINNCVKYKITLHYKNGLVLTNKGYNLDLINDDGEVGVPLRDKQGDDCASVWFNVRDAEFDVNKMAYIVKAENLDVEYEDDEAYRELVRCAKETEVDYLSFSRSESNIHYVL